MCDNNGDNDANDLPSTPPQVADIAEKAVVGLVPQKSRQQWCVSKSENGFLAFFVLF
jgi:hypothetical protein